YVGAFAAAASIWALFAHNWTAVAFAGVMLGLAALVRWRGTLSTQKHLQAQYTLLGALTMYRAVVVNLHLESQPPAHVKMRLLTLPILGPVFYLAAKLAALRNDPEQRI